MKYRNRGAPFTRDDGSIWEQDMEAVPTDNELARRRYKLRAVVAEIVPAPSPPPAEEGEEGEGPISVWSLQMKPEQYLLLYPEGPNAAHARELVAAQEQEGAGEDGPSDG